MKKISLCTLRLLCFRKIVEWVHFCGLFKNYQECPHRPGQSQKEVACFLPAVFPHHCTFFFFFLIYSVSECGSVHGLFPMSFLSVQMSDMKQERMYVWQLPNKLGEDQVKDNCSGLWKKTKNKNLWPVKNFLWKACFVGTSCYFANNLWIYFTVCF